MSSWAASVELTLEGCLEVHAGDAKAAGTRQQVANEAASFPLTLLRFPVVSDLLDEGPCALPGADEPVILQSAIGLHHRRGVDAKAGGQLPYRRQAIPGAQLARRNCHPQLGGDLGVTNVRIASVVYGLKSFPDNHLGHVAAC